jgi:hypothetical protein
LALALGQEHPNRLLAQLSESEFVGWQKYYNLEPFGVHRQDAGHAIVAATIATVMTGKVHKPTAFMPRYDENDSGISEQHAAMFKDIAQRWNTNRGKNR